MNFNNSKNQKNKRLPLLRALAKRATEGEGTANNKKIFFPAYPYFKK
jgi:hypothetical protein